MTPHGTGDAGEALDLHVRTFFAGHPISREHWPVGPIEDRLPGFFLYVVGPGPRFPGWTYLTAGCWGHAAGQHPHGLEFVLSAADRHDRHLEVMTMLAYYHAGPANQFLDLGHTVPIGEPWMPGSLCDHHLIALPYASGPELETCEWPTGHTRILTALPITSAQRNFKIRRGVDALERRLERAKTNFADPYRGSVA